ncbi:hypothetical protein PUN28_017555 [Cardiocondyla obscurior]|uniref:Uncharacterized protein n=1 Tax=Cardiocondyla obscurior TaxID=286306 RepID=A0AAW2EKB1_9HYME
MTRCYRSVNGKIAKEFLCKLFLITRTNILNRVYRDMDNRSGQSGLKKSTKKRTKKNKKINKKKIKKNNNNKKEEEKKGTPNDRHVRKHRTSSVTEKGGGVGRSNRYLRILDLLGIGRCARGLQDAVQLYVRGLDQLSANRTGRV